MKIGTVLSAIAIAAFLPEAMAQMEGDEIGDEVCVEGYVMDDFCIELGM